MAGPHHRALFQLPPHMVQCTRAARMTGPHHRALFLLPGLAAECCPPSLHTHTRCPVPPQKREADVAASEAAAVADEEARMTRIREAYERAIADELQDKIRKTVDEEMVRPAEVAVAVAVAVGGWGKEGGRGPRV